MVVVCYFTIALRIDVIQEYFLHNYSYTMAGKNQQPGVRPQDSELAHYALYKVDDNKLNEESVNGESNQESEMSGLQCVCCSLSSKHENLLRLFLVRRLRKGAVYVGTGTFSGMEFSIGGNLPAICYYILLPSQALVCLLATADANLEVFRPELTKFCVELELHVQEPSVSDLLSNWYVKCVQYISRVLENLGPEIAVLMQLVQQNGGIKLSKEVPSSLAADIQLFLAACSVAECLVGASPEKDAFINLKTGGKYIITGVKANLYCSEWARLLIDSGSTAEPWQLRKLLEAFKLKTIKDMNILKRILKQAETDHYFLYRAYSFLWQSGNSDVLLRQAALEGTSSDVLNVLEEHLTTCTTPISVITRV